MLRQFLLFLSRQRTLRRWFETSQAAQRFTSRFVAGETLDDVMSVCQKLHRERILATLDHLGENVSTREDANASMREVEAALGAIASSGLPATLSVKLTQLGLDLGDDLCYRNVAILAERAKAIGSRVEIDMESHEYTDRTLAIVERAHQEFGCVRAVLQAYLFRTEEDVRRMCRLGIPVRLCKGAYDEPASVAFPEKQKVDENYLKLAGILLQEGLLPALATHDPNMIAGVRAQAGKAARTNTDFEFQMLYGVRRDLQNQLIAAGFQLRLYVPYGDAWYPYFMRRLAERPANVLFVAKNLLRA